jgi:hypothetical protein
MPDKKQVHPVQTAQDEQPPVLGSWGRMYGVVVAELCVLIALFYLFTRAFE